MVKITQLVVWIGLLTVTQLFAQRNCGTTEYMHQHQLNNPQLLQIAQEIENHTSQFITTYQPSGRAVITIPVVFHVIYNTTSQNISDARINAQIDQLNKDFARQNADAVNTPSVFQSLGANTEIQFCLAKRDPSGNATTGIIRKTTTVSSFSTNDNVKRSANGGNDPWNVNAYLNIWSCNLSNGVLGYAQFPGYPPATDGVVLLFSTIGSTTTPGTIANYNLGRTATHEVGHWLNLFHIWGDDGTACTGSDQNADTP
ncbi:MAG: M43 family zinc metalloprotease, partial [Bacteroidota bacterium]